MKKILPFLITISALSISGSAAFFSVFGLSKLFAGAATAVIIMAGTLEASKLIIATLLHQYWNKLSIFLRVYLTIATLVLIMITSMGIYGFLSAAFQQTANTSAIVDKEITLIDARIESFVKQKDLKLESLNGIEERIAQLNEGITNIEYSWVDRDGAGEQRELLSKQLEISNSDYIRLTSEISDIDSTILTLENDRFNVEINSDVAAELGPLKYISEITEKPMAQVVNILLLIIVFVFDPLAISLVIAANRSFEIAYSKPDYSNNITDMTSNKNVIEPVPNVILEQSTEKEADAEDLPKLEETEEVEEKKENDSKEEYPVSEPKRKRNRRRSGGYWF
jgi:hypothetical protein